MSATLAPVRVWGEDLGVVKRRPDLSTPGSDNHHCPDETRPVLPFRFQRALEFHTLESLRLEATVSLAGDFVLVIEARGIAGPCFIIRRWLENFLGRTPGMALAGLLA